ncbi:VOC family protein [Luteipulveratus sp. YIM 133132]|uniref:VOC family protein n=1 Tax=Luteipulveratus flavus TaxID=3031728 RepID=UPI0023B016F0|nr:VOC family protein [Luteipulveratus sp. YIM 133132]MDE9365437.1 VOC family protein [Luteipulveratus sp. YIM 133132]
MATRDTPWPAGTPCWIDCGFEDLDRARRFYGHLFGWDTDEGEGPNHYTTCLKNHRVVAGMSESQDEHAPTVWTTYFATEDVEVTTEAVRRAGGEVVLDATDIDAQGRLAIYRDPTGATFSVWQGGDLTGVQVFGEPGSMAWNDLITRDLEAAKTFYAAVFGYTYEDMGGGYVTFRPPGFEGMAGGMHQAAELADDADPHWLVHFAVADRDATVALAEMEDDVDVLMTMSTPFGPEATLRGAEGEVFNIIALNDGS